MAARLICLSLVVLFPCYHAEREEGARTIEVDYSLNSAASKQNHSFDSERKQAESESTRKGGGKEAEAYKLDQRGNAVNMPWWGTTVSTTRLPCIPLSVNADKDNAINIVFIPSGFKGNIKEWDSAAGRVFSKLRKYKPFDAPNVFGLNIWKVGTWFDDDAMMGKYMEWDKNMDRLLKVKRPSKFKAHMREACGTGFLMQGIVIHSDLTYGGSGGDLAAVSAHAQAGRIAAHELAHSLFGLGDEYTYYSIPQGGDYLPNCDVKGCPLWKDLIDARMRGVGCISGWSGRCLNGKHHAGSNSLMLALTYEYFGPVNERITCCSYLRETHTIPPYCEKFTDEAKKLNLKKFCATGKWKGLLTHRVHRAGGWFSLLQDGNIASPEIGGSSPGIESFNHMKVEKPVQWLLVNTNGKWQCEQGNDKLEKGRYVVNSVLGDESAHQADVSDLDRLKVNIFSSSGAFNRSLYFDTRDDLTVPPEHHTEHEQTVKQSGYKEEIEVVLSEGENCQIEQRDP